MVSDATETIKATGTVLVFGGPYSNAQATRAILDEAKRLRIPRSHTICTGDIVAYCGSPAATIELVRRAKIHVVMGNCDEQLGNDGLDCGCGFPEGSSCERLSSAWFGYADREVGAADRRWLAKLPKRVDLDIGGFRLAVIHGSVSSINSFVFATSEQALKRRELELCGADGVIAGHTGIPFTEVVDGLLWHNAGVVGMPANDGTSRVWYSLIHPTDGGLSIEHRALAYDHAAAAAEMEAAGLPSEYRTALGTGLWPSCDVLPRHETARQGQRIEPGVIAWSGPQKRTSVAAGVSVLGGETRLLWPDTFRNSTMARTPATNDAALPAAGVSCCTPVEPAPTASASCCAPTNAEATRELYRDAALNPDSTLCCITNSTWQLPGLAIPRRMIEMNYGCGSTVHPGDLGGSPTVLYVGAGGGLELLQFAYFSRRRGAIIGLDVVDEMLDACRRNLVEAEETNDWFKQSFVDLRKGDAMALPIADGSVDVAAQSCLFNIFHSDDLKRALSEISRVLRPGGRLLLSDPICEAEIPEALRADERLRAMCLTGALPLSGYIQRLADAGFGRIEVRARRPYRVLGPGQFATEHPIVLESVEICAIKCDVPADGPAVYAGEMAIYFGADASFNDGSGLSLPANQPLPVSMGDAARLRSLRRADIHVSAPSWFHAGASSGGGCC